MSTIKEPDHEAELVKSVKALWAKDPATGRSIVDRALGFCGVDKISLMNDRQKRILKSQVDELLSLPF